MKLWVASYIYETDLLPFGTCDFHLRTCDSEFNLKYTLCRLSNKFEANPEGLTISGAHGKSISEKLRRTTSYLKYGKLEISTTVAIS